MSKMIAQKSEVEAANDPAFLHKVTGRDRVWSVMVILFFALLSFHPSLTPIICYLTLMLIFLGVNKTKEES